MRYSKLFLVFILAAVLSAGVLAQNATPAAAVRKNPHDKPYFGDELPFRPIDETCKAGGRAAHTALTVKPDAEDTNNATVRAIFAFGQPCKDPDKTEYTVELVKSGTAWLIDDVLYKDNRSLKLDLKRKDY